MSRLKFSLRVKKGEEREEFLKEEKKKGWNEKKNLAICVKIVLKGLILFII